jgi:tetratricopeptide (TPR) repeat protein
MNEVLSTKQVESEGEAAYIAGDYLQAAQLYKTAQSGLEVQGDKIRAAEMANNCSVALLKAGEAKDALLVLEGTYEVFEGVGDTRRQAMALGNRAAALDVLKESEAAMKAYQDAAELFNQIEEQELYLSTMQALSALQLRTGNQLGALGTMQAGINKLESPNIKQRLLRRLLDLPHKLINR